MKLNIKKKRKADINKRIIQMYTNLFFLIFLLVFFVIGLFHVFTHKRAYRDEGVVNYNRGNYELAIMDLKKAYNVDQWFANPINVDILMYEAASYMKLNDFKSANDVYRQIQSDYKSKYYDDEQIEFLITLTDGLDAYLQGDYEQEELFVDAVDRGYIDMCLYAADCMEHHEKYDLARTYYDKYQEVCGLNSVLCYKYMSYYMRKGLYGEAYAFATKGLEFNDPEYYKPLEYAQIVCKERLHNYQEAYALANAYLAKYPDDQAAKDQLNFLKTRIEANDTTVYEEYYGIEGVDNQTRQ